MSSLAPVILLGSARGDGDTANVVSHLHSLIGGEVIDLLDYTIAQYTYDHRSEDDFLPLVRRIITHHDTLIFATPVYWYAMSGIMKVFFDRLTDLLKLEKALGRRLRGKKMAAISSSNGGNLGKNFWLPFRESASYLGMEWLGGLHTIIGDNYESQIAMFVEQTGTGQA